MYDSYPYEQKMEEIFSGHVVLKRLVAQNDLDFIPRYVAEYILANFINKSGNVEQGASAARQYVNSNYPERGSSERLKHKLMDNGELNILQNFSVKVDLKTGQYSSYLAILDTLIEIDPSFVEYYPKLMGDGMWGVGKLAYKTDQIGPFTTELRDFKPVQVGNFDFNHWKHARLQFTTDEWIDMLIQSMGLRPSNLNGAEKLLLISRTLPLVTKNLNIAEFGPKGTGKTYTFRHLTSYAHIISGSAVTPAKLIYDIKSRTPGIITFSDCVIFDEITSARFGDKKDFELVGMLKDFMEGGNVSRGHFSVQTDSSLMFIGNIDMRDNKPKFSDFTRELPEIFQDTAFLDRIHAMIPGWAIPKVTESHKHITERVGLIGNYLSEAFHRLRNYSHPHLEWKKREKDLGFIRNEKAVRKIADGFLKVLFPGVEPTEDELRAIFDIACDLRQVVYDQLHEIDPDEYYKMKLRVEP